VNKTLPAKLPLNLHLQHLVYFREVQRRGGISEAARALSVSQPALSQALSEMEKRLGVALYEREGRKRHLTAAGEEFLRFAQEVLERAEEVERRLQDRRQGRSGVLRVGMIDAASLYVLPATMQAFRAKRPEVDLALTVAPSEQLLHALRHYQLDLAIAVGPRNDPGFSAVRIRREPLLIYAPPGSRGRKLQDCEWILYPPHSRTRAVIDAALSEKGITPRITLESGSPEVLRQLVSLGLGYSVLPEKVAEGASRSLRRVFKTPLAYRELLAFRRKNAPFDALAEEFTEMARGV